jgi:hypothetical protein
VSARAPCRKKEYLDWSTCTEGLTAEPLSKAPARKRTTLGAAQLQKRRERTIISCRRQPPPITREHVLSFQLLPQISGSRRHAGDSASGAAGDCDDAHVPGDMGADGAADDFGDWHADDDENCDARPDIADTENAGRKSLGLDMLAAPTKVTATQVRYWHPHRLHNACR